MKKIVCRRCNQCGYYHSLHVDRCRCGADLSRTPGMLVESNIPVTQYGDIDPDMPVYVQKCSACGTENFTADPEKRARVCCNCHKPRIASVVPVLFEEEKKPEPKPETPPRIAPIVTGDDEDEDDDDDDEAASYLAILEGIQQSTRSADLIPEDREAPVSPPPVRQEDEDDDDEDDGEAAMWENLAGLKGSPLVPPRKAPVPDTPKKPVSERPKAAPPAVSTLTLSAIRFGSFTFSLRSDSPELPYLLGRSAGCADFLMQDGYVGNRHCYLAYRSGNWYVLNNRARNGTRVNDLDLDPEGEQILRSGDTLTLGHNPASMAFRVTIR